MLMQLVWQAISGIVTKPWRRLSTRQVLSPPVIRLRLAKMELVEIARVRPR